MVKSSYSLSRKAANTILTKFPNVFVHDSYTVRGHFEKCLTTVTGQPVTITRESSFVDKSHCEKCYSHIKIIQKFNKNSLKCIYEFVIYRRTLDIMSGRISRLNIDSGIISLSADIRYIRTYTGYCLCLWSKLFLGSLLEVTDVIILIPC